MASLSFLVYNRAANDDKGFVLSWIVISQDRTAHQRSHRLCQLQGVRLSALWMWVTSWPCEQPHSSKMLQMKLGK